MKYLNALIAPVLFLASTTAQAIESPDFMDAGWKVESDEGELALSRGTENLPEGSGEAFSLRLESVGGPAKGKAILPVDLQAGRDYAFTGQVRAGGKLDYVALALVTPASDQTWHEINSFAKAVGWSRLGEKVSVPADAEEVFLVLYLSGEGAANVSDLALADPNLLTRSPVLSDFARGFDYTYKDFDRGRIKVADGWATIQAKGGRGGAGVNEKLDLSPFAELTPEIDVVVLPGNKAKSFRFFAQDGNGVKQEYTFYINKLPAGGEASSVTASAPVPLGTADPAGNRAFDPSSVEGWQVQGDWKPAPLHIRIDEIRFVSLDENMRKQANDYLRRRQGVAERRAREKAEREAARASMLEEGVQTDPEGPRLVHIAAVDDSIIGIELEAGRIANDGQKPYSRQSGDRIVPEKKKKTALAHDPDGSGIVESPLAFKAIREGDGKTRHLGYHVRPYGSEEEYVVRDRLAGSHLKELVADAPGAYRVRSDDDPNYTEPVEPTAVYRKSRPLDRTYVDGKPERTAIEHKLYLELPAPMRPGARYEVEFLGLNTREAGANFLYDPRSVRSESIHTTQIGYHPDDPFKRAYLSLWLGTGGAHAFEVDEFHLIDENGETAHTGAIELAFAANQAEGLKDSKNYAKTNVYWMDFHDFDRPGTWRVHVPGVGVSYPITLSEENTWAEAFKTSMHGFLSHRSGIALGEPFTDYHRPRNMHPGDVPVYRLPTTRLEGEVDAVSRGLKQQLGDSLNPAKLETHPNAWGGYMDAGDWDRRSHHLGASYLHLELVERFPKHFEALKLALPPEEANNNLPDVLDEALYNIYFYARLQEPHGGVGGGVESTAHPIKGYASWQERLLIGVFAPDPVTSYIYAATAAKAALVMKPYDLDRAKAMLVSAEKAYAWAEANLESEFAAAKERGKKSFNLGKSRREATEWHRLANLELYKATGKADYREKLDADMRDALKDSGRNRDLLFGYAILPADKADPQLQQEAGQALLHLADDALEFQKNNAFQLTTHASGLPPIGYVGYWSAPEMSTGPILPRAYLLSGDRKYLAGAVAATQYGSGANPMNMTMTTGVGYDWPTGVLHIDSRVTGQEVPRGITVYGHSDPALRAGYVDWAHQWVLREVMTPGSREWPGHEGYVGVFGWPAVNEYTVFQTIGPTSYYWGFLSAADRNGAD